MKVRSVYRAASFFFFLLFLPPSNAQDITGLGGWLTGCIGPTVVYGTWAGGVADGSKAIDGGGGGRTASNVNWVQPSTDVIDLPHTFTVTFGTSSVTTVEEFFLWNDFGEVGQGVKDFELTFRDANGSQIGGIFNGTASNTTDRLAAPQSFPLKATYISPTSVEFKVRTVYGTNSSSGGDSRSYQFGELAFGSSSNHHAIFLLAGQSEVVPFL